MTETERDTLIKLGTIEAEAMDWRNKAELLQAQGKPIAAAIAEGKAEALEWAAMVVRRSN